MKKANLLKAAILLFMLASAAIAVQAEEVYFSPTDCPDGWVKNAAYEDRMLKGSASYGTQGGSSSTSGAQGSSGYAKAGPGNDAGSHTHEIDPPYVALNFCQPANTTLRYNAYQKGQTAIIPNTQSCTSGSRFTGLDNRYPRGGQTAGATGGSFTTSSASGGSYTYGTTPGNDGNPHTHTADPPHTETVFCEMASYPELPMQMIFMSNASCPEGYIRYAEMDGRFPKGANAANLNTSGGSDTTSGASGFGFGVKDGGSGGGHGGGHTHTYTPPYYELVFCQSNSTWNSPPNMTIEVSEILWQHNFTVQVNTSDPEDDEVSINMTINGNLMQATDTFTYEGTADQPEYNITVAISDGEYRVTESILENTYNTAPEITAVNITTGYENESALCLYEYNDSENNSITAEYIWSLNGTNKLNDSVISAENLTAGLVVSCQVQLFDGLNYSDWTTSQNKTILAIPVIEEDEEEENDTQETNEEEQAIPAVQHSAPTISSGGGSALYGNTPQIIDLALEQLVSNATKPVEETSSEVFQARSSPDIIVPSDPIGNLAKDQQKQSEEIQINWVIVIISASISTIVGSFNLKNMNWV